MKYLKCVYYKIVGYFKSTKSVEPIKPVEITEPKPKRKYVRKNKNVTN